MKHLSHAGFERVRGGCSQDKKPAHKRPSLRSNQPRRIASGRDGRLITGRLPSAALAVSWRGAEGSPARNQETAALARQAKRTPHEIALNCLEILASLSGKTITDASSVLANLRRLAASYPDPDPFASSAVVEWSGHSANSWHAVVRKVAADWGARLPVALDEARQSGQTTGCPLLSVDTDKVHSYLNSEVQVCFGKEPALAQQTGGAPPQPGSAVEALLGDESRQVLTIAQSDQSADSKMRAICAIDRRFLAWKSPQWAELLRVSEGAIRKTAFWTQDRQQAIKADSELRRQ